MFLTQIHNYVMGTNIVVFQVTDMLLFLPLKYIFYDNTFAICCMYFV